MRNPRDPNLPQTRSRLWVLGAVALAVAIGVIYYVLTIGTEENVELDGPVGPDPAAVEDGSSGSGGSANIGAADTGGTAGDGQAGAGGAPP